MNDFLLKAQLIDIASYLLVLGGIFIAVNISRRTGESFFKILFGVDRIKLIRLISPMEKTLILLLFAIVFASGYLGTHGVATIGDLVRQ